MPIADYSQVKNVGFLVPPGRYRVRIVKAVLPPNKDKGGNDNVQVKYEILDGTDKVSIGAPLTDFVNYTGPRAWKFRALTMALNASASEGQPTFRDGENWECEWLINRELEIVVDYGVMKDEATGKYVPNTAKRSVEQYLPFVPPSDIPADFENFAKALG